MILLGIIAAAVVGLCAGDVSHVVGGGGGGGQRVNAAAAAINLLAHADQPAEGTFWWMDRDSALGRASADYQHTAASDKSHAFAANPFLSGRVAVSDVPPAAHGPEKLDLSTNPFFNGGISGGIHAGSTASSGAATSAAGTECRGDGYICVQRADCHAGVINTDGFGLIQVRNQVSFCNPKTEVCCRYKDHELIGGKSSVHKAPVLDVTNLGETGADVNRLAAGSGSSTSKPTRDAPFVGSTIDYSNTHFGDEVRFASTIRGPAYLPPVDPTRQPPKTPPPPIDVPRCQGGQQLINGQCQCPSGLVNQGGRCVPRPPPPPPSCTGGQQFINGQCQCPSGLVLQNGYCAPRPTPPPSCPPGQQYINGQCQCTGGLVYQGGRCVPRPTPPPPPPTCGFGEYLVNGRCVSRPTPPPPPTCAYGEILQNNVCVTRPTPRPPPPRCAPNEYLSNGVCVPRPTPPTQRCNYNEQLVNGQCIPKATPPPPIVTKPTYLPPSPNCGPNELYQNGRCVPKTTQPPPLIPSCQGGQQLINGQCQCPSGLVYQGGRCVPRPTPPPQPTCSGGQQFINGQCQCPSGLVFQNGFCSPRPTPPPSCPPGQQFINGQCQCSGGLIYQNGRCVPRPTPPPPPPSCPGGQQYINGQCQCTNGLVFLGGRCVPRPTPPPLPTCSGGQQFMNGQCQCPSGLVFQNGFCAPRPTPPPSCPPGQQYINGQCQCSGGLIYQNGRCVPRATPPPPTPSKPTYLPPGIQCGPNQYEQNGQCYNRPTPPPPTPPTVRCGYNEQLINGICVPKPPTCRPNEYLSNGVCVARPTPPPTPPAVYCSGGQQNIGGVCRCVGNTVLQNGRCVTPVDETRNPCTGNQFYQNGQCISCRPGEVFQNGQCVPRATPPPPTTPSAYLPPVTCGYDQILQGGRCVPRPTPAPPLICTGNTYLQNGVCVPRPTQPTTGGPGYHYPTPTPAFTIPDFTGEGNSVNNVYVSTTTTRRPTERPDNQDSGTSNDPNYVRPNIGPNEPVLPGCAAALKCVQEIYCTAEGFVSPVPVVFTKEQEFSRVPLTDCADQEAGIVGKCCRDPDYKDPWPSANLVNGIDNGQYREDPSLGQYSGDVRNNRLTRSNTGIQQFQPQGQQPQCGVRHRDAQPRGPGPLDAHFAEIPWQAMILRDSNRSLLCGGAIIRKNAVLTSAHCVEGLEAHDVLIKGGEWKLGIDEEPLPFQIVKVKRIIVHPQYDSENLQNDVAILLLEEKLRYTKNIGNICLPAPGEHPTGQCIVTGWGKKVLQIHLKDAIMRTIDVNLIPGQECRAAMETNFPTLMNRLGEHTYCAASKADQCKVDHGSALACTTDGLHYTLHGVFSWDTSCKDERQLGAYIQPDVAWIESALTPKGRVY